MTRRQRSLTPGVEEIQLVTRERVWNMPAIAKRHQRQAEALPVSENHSSACEDRRLHNKVLCLESS